MTYITILDEKKVEKDSIRDGVNLNYVYILRCSDDTLYTGYTNNLDKRVSVHNSGKGAKYTRYRLPVELVYFEEHNTKSEAIKREYVIKQLARKEKLKLISLNNNT